MIRLTWHLVRLLMYFVLFVGGVLLMYHGWAIGDELKRIEGLLFLILANLTAKD